MKEWVERYYLFVLAFVSFSFVMFGIVDLKDEIQSSVFAADNRFGIQIDTNGKVPSVDQISSLNASWVRFVWRPNIGIPQLPANTKILLVVNNESAPPAPIGSTDIQTWKNYTDSIYIPQLSQIVSTSPNISAIEVWNEQDLCDRGGDFCPGIPEEAFAYLLKKAAFTIKAINPNITVVMGGLASGQTSYVRNVMNSDPSALSQIDAIGLHPYGQSPDGWCKGN